MHLGRWWQMKGNPVCVGVKVPFGLVSDQPEVQTPPHLGRFCAAEISRLSLVSE